jgi:arylformamidase
MIYDITPPISSQLAVWPGDTPPTREVLLDMHGGANLTLSSLHATVHLGAHVDAPSHYGADASSIEEMTLERYLGPCQVVRVDVAAGRRITPEMVTTPLKAERVLFATDTFPDPTEFNEDFAALSPELVHFVAGQGIRLVGIDTPSVDLFGSKALEAHKACLEEDVAILEGIVLAGVPEDVYELLALPLKLVGFDASPVRAVLRKEK